MEGRRVGLIGYITDLTPTITSADLATLTFEDVSQSQLRSSLPPFSQEVESVRKEAQRLKAQDPPVDVLIALGHAGYREVGPYIV